MFLITCRHFQQILHKILHTLSLNSLKTQRVLVLSGNCTYFLSMSMYLELLLTLTVLTIQGQRPGSIEENATPQVPMEVCDAGENCRKGMFFLFASSHYTGPSPVWQNIYSKNISAINALALTRLLYKTHFYLGLTLVDPSLVSLRLQWTPWLPWTQTGDGSMTLATPTALTGIHGEHWLVPVMSRDLNTGLWLVNCPPTLPLTDQYLGTAASALMSRAALTTATLRGSTVIRWHIIGPLIIIHLLIHFL